VIKPEHETIPMAKGYIINKEGSEYYATLGSQSGMMTIHWYVNLLLVA
jgi:hypothetical protein